MKNTRDWFTMIAQWVEYGDGSGSYTAAYVSVQLLLLLMVLM